jgi:transcriptional regulator with XRE-family HTH domain
LLNRQSQHPKSARHDALLQRLGTTIRTYRQQKRLSLETLKELTNLSPSYLAQIERGERNATVLSLIRIADALDIPYTDLLEPLNAFRPSSPQADHPINQSL